MKDYLMTGIPVLLLLLAAGCIVLYNRLRIKVEEAGAGIDAALVNDARMIQL